MASYHVYSQTVADGTATSVVRPSDWNSAHVQAMTLSGNTAGQSTVSGTNIVFQGGNNITLSANTAANAATVVISTPPSAESMFFAGNTAGQSSIGVNADGFYLAGGDNVTLSANGSTVSIVGGGGGGGAGTRQYFDNLGPLATVSGAMGGKAVGVNIVHIFPLKPFADVFNGSMTINTLLIDISCSGSTATMSGALSTTVQFGLYTINSTAASLSASMINSFSAVIGCPAANAANSNSWAGQRFISVHSSQWSSQPVLSDNVQYVCAMRFGTGASSANTFNMLGGFMGSTVSRSGFIGVSQTNATWNGAGGPFLGNYGTTSTGLPAGINYTQVNRQSASANFIPHLIGHNFTQLTYL